MPLHSVALKQLMGMAECSLAILNGLADMCRVRLCDSGQPSCITRPFLPVTLADGLLHVLCSAALKRLTGMAGRSLAIYNGLADLCRVRLRDSEQSYCGVKEASYCTMRSQLVMALHDNNVSEITSKVGIARNLLIQTV